MLGLIYYTIKLPYTSWESLAVDEECVRRWGADLSPRTARNYVYYFLKYVAWAKENGYWSSAEEILADREDLDEKESFRHVDVLERYLRSLDTGVKDKRNRWYAVRSFYEYHRLALPQPPRTEISRVLKPSDKDKKRAIQLKPLEAEEVRQLVLNAPQPYKAAFMVLFQSAMGLSEFEEFNTIGWKPAVNRIDEPGPIRLDLYRTKTSRTKVSKYYTFIGEDAKRLIKDWLAMRPDVDSNALFLVFHKISRKWVPLKGRNIGDNVTSVAKRIRLIEENGLDRYHIHAHEFRDLFKSLCTIKGVNSIASEFFLGHTIDRMGYDKSPEYDEGWFRREYLKVEPELNLLSGEGNREDMKKEVALEAIRRFAEAFGIEPMRVRIEKQRNLGRELNSEEEIQAIQNEIKKIRSGDSDPQLIVTEEDLERYLLDGWQFVSVLPSQKILVKK